MPLNAAGLLLLPVFFVVTGLNVNMGALSRADLLELGAIIVVACAGTYLGAAVPARPAGMRWREASTLGLALAARLGDLPAVSAIATAPGSRPALRGEVSESGRWGRRLAHDVGP